MPEYIFKTVYFPRERVKVGKSARVTVSVPTTPTFTGSDKNFVTYVKGLSSRDLRLAMGDPHLESLEEHAQREGRSFSNVCLRLLTEHYQTKIGGSSTGGESYVEQLMLPYPSDLPPTNQSIRTEPKADLGITFKDSLRQHVYGWYPYVEGFSATYTRDAILRYSPRTVYDPFGGTGTTQLAAAILGIPSFYSEVNPLMVFVAETKIKSASWARQNYNTFKAIAESFLRELTPERLDKLGMNTCLASYEHAFPDRNFFVERDLRHLLAARDLATEFAGDAHHAKSLLLLACAANAVGSSNMTRRADLRRRRADEYKNRIVNVAQYVSDTVRRMLRDIPHLPLNIASTQKISEDCRSIPSQYKYSFDLALTSPPYLNGTNYFRNTKIELWLLGFIESETELKTFRKKAICAGINNVLKERNEPERFESVEHVVEKVEKRAKDRRIPRLIRHYFSDMKSMFEGVLQSLSDNGTFLLDIGDSKFYGVHVPTDHLLIDVARSVGFQLKNRHLLARRLSRDKTEMVQVELVLRKPSRPTATKRRSNSGGTLSESIEKFSRELPYKTHPYTKRSWGHNLHSLCSYQGKLKPSIAHWLVREFTPSGSRILDPLGGAGTIPFEAALQGKYAVSNDMNPFASIVAAAKLDPPSLEEAQSSLRNLENQMRKAVLTEGDWSSAKFGLNGTVVDYYHKETLEEVLKARRVFISMANSNNRGDIFIWASLLHVLHGNRPYALSRSSHPITPFHPRGPKVYKNLVEKVDERIKRALSTPLPAEFYRGSGLNGDFRDLPRHQLDPFDAIITSPPFLGMRFDRPNWLRLWFCGWGEEDFHKTSLGFLERQQTKSTECYRDFFSVCRALLKEDGLLLVHLGSGRRSNLVDDLKRMPSSKFRLNGEVTENVQAIEQHGIRDKGLTTTHHLLFFTPI